MFAIFFSALQLIALANALRVCHREGFTVGTLGAVARLLLLLLGAVAMVWIRFVRFPGSEVPAPALAVVMAAAEAFVGPVVSFTAIGLAHRRQKDVPASQEEKLRRPFMAWLPVAIFDAAFVTVNVFGHLIINGG